VKRGGRSFFSIENAFALQATLLLAFFLLPLAGLLARVPWATAWEELRGERVLEAMRLSLVAASLASVISLAFGFPLAWVLCRRSFRGKELMRALVLLPMVFPPVVGGVALLAAFGTRGLLGGVLAYLGVRLPFTFAAAVLAATFVSAPFLVLALEAGLASADRRLEEAAETLGARPARVLSTITLPSVRHSIVAGLALTWARAAGEFGATITFAGNFPGRTQTMPLAIYEALQTDMNGAILMSVLLLGVSLVALLVLRRRIVQP